ncbi:NlpC/P60 family protein [Clostridium thailandense]|uniref:C40 family peptidase n=1 Tax=Clostridium thailandense TaxID=2794346 RepID=UPI003989FF1D
MILNKISKLVTAAFMGVFIVTTPVLAKPLDSNNQILGNGNVEKNIEMLDNQIEGAIRQVESNKKDIADVQNQMSNLQKDMANTEKDIAFHQDLFKKRARAAYMSGADNYLEIMLDSKNIQDFIWRLEAVKKIIEFDKNVVSQLSSKKEKIIVEQKQLKDKSNKLVTLKEQNEKKLAKLKTDKENQKKLLAQAPQNNFAIASTANVLSSSGSRNNLSRGALHITGGSNSDVVSYASNFLGTPYVWGGTSPSGFDCSGFTQYVYGHFGVGLGRTTYEQISDGVAVSRSQLQPGDLVLFGTSSNPHHVGIYVGDGMYIHAPRTGDVVKVSSLDRGDFVAGRRVK